MFERYTEKARRTIFFARDEAGSFGSPYIVSEHLLLGILRERHDWLLSAGDSMKLVEDIRSILPHNEKIITSVDLPLSHSVKVCLAYSAEEAELMEHNNIDTGHMLLGLLRTETPISAALNRYGITLDSLREDLEKLIAPRSRETSIVFERRSELTPLLPRLSSEVEPATVFSLQPVAKETPR